MTSTKSLYVFSTDATIPSQNIAGPLQRRHSAPSHCTNPILHSCHGSSCLCCWFSSQLTSLRQRACSSHAAHQMLALSVAGQWLPTPTTSTKLRLLLQ